MITSLMRRIAPAALALACGAGVAAAQGNLSTQGFGYPAGPFSTRSLAAGGAWGEVEPMSAINPATIALWGALVLSGQYDPEFRRVTTPNGSVRTTTARFPAAAVSMPIGSRYAVGLSATSYLDRTWATNVETQQVIGVDTVTSTQRLASDGGITDVRLALARALGSNFSVGVAAHVFSGENRLTVAQEFPDTVRFSSLFTQSELTYGGTAFSVGLEGRFRRVLQVGASYRHGGDITAESNDTTVSRAKIPRRYGFSVGYSGIAGVALGVRATHEQWSALAPLGSSRMSAFDSWDVGAGAEATGPRIGRRVVMLRAGARKRTLPFGADGGKVDELSLSTGFGLPIAFDRAHLDVALIRANRTASGARSDVDESAYILSFGVRVRP